MNARWLPALWASGVILLILGVFNWDPRTIFDHWFYVDDWGRDGSDRAMIGGAVLLGVAAALTIARRFKPRDGE